MKKPTCCMCGAPSNDFGYCKMHQDIMIQQFVLDALNKWGKSTARMVADHIWAKTRIHFGGPTVVSALRVLHQQGYVLRHESPVRGKAAFWEVV